MGDPGLATCNRCVLNTRRKLFSNDMNHRSSNSENSDKSFNDNNNDKNSDNEYIYIIYDNILQ